MALAKRILENIFRYPMLIFCQNQKTQRISPMDRIRQLFTDHPASVGESYFEHLAMAFSFSFRMIGGGLACLIHGVFPFLFRSSGSQCIRELNERMVTHRQRKAAAAEWQAGPAE